MFQPALRLSATLLLTLTLSTIPLAEAAAGPSALVKTTRATEGTLAAQLTAYGTVKPDPGHIKGISVAHGGLVTRLWVGRGQVVKAGQRLLELSTDPQSRRDYDQAKAKLAFARKNLDQVRSLFQQQLATHADLAKAKQDLSNAKSSLRALRRNGANRAHEVIKADEDAVVTSLKVSPGDRVGTGSLLLTLGARNRLWVSLGIEPEDSQQVHPGMPVRLHPVFAPDRTIHAKVAQVHALINPQTRLVDAVIKLQGKQTAPLVPGMHVVGAITTRQVHGVIVPVQSVLHDHNGAYLFVVRQHRAHRVTVQTGIERDGRVVITRGLQQGQTVVTQGNYELKDGMAVRTRQAGGKARHQTSGGDS